MNHSIKLRHGWYNLHFDAHHDDDDDIDDLEYHEVDYYNDDKDEDDSIKISQSFLDLHFDGRSVICGPINTGPSYLSPIFRF